MPKFATSRRTPEKLNRWRADAQTSARGHAGRYDLEIPVNIVDLGLVYRAAVDGGVVTVEMTRTAPGCSMGAMNRAEIEDKLFGLPPRGDLAQ